MDTEINDRFARHERMRKSALAILKVAVEKAKCAQRGATTLYLGDGPELDLAFSVLAEDHLWSAHRRNRHPGNLEPSVENPDL